MRWLVLFVLLAGCTSPSNDPTTSSDPEDPDECGLDSGTNQTLYFGPSGLQRDLPDAGRMAGNGFNQAFLSNDIFEWRGDAGVVLIKGNITLHYWVDHKGTAPVAVGDPGEGYFLFNQLGTLDGFVPAYHTVFESVIGDGVHEYEELYAMPDGGLYVNHTLRVLLTGLDEGPDGPHDVLFGGDTPSRIEYHAWCAPELSFAPLEEMSEEVSIPANQGLLAPADAATEGVNFQDVPFTLSEATDRLQIRITQTNDPGPTKDDIDLSVRQAGVEVWSIGSPYTDEVGTQYRWHMLPAGDYVIRVNSYSGTAYEGRLDVVQQTFT